MPLSGFYASVDKVVQRDDIRGVYGRGVDASLARALGLALADLYRKHSPLTPVNIAVGHDMRLSGPLLARALAQGLEDGGCRAIHMGMVGTELVGFLASHYSQVIDGGVMVTASHNPPDNNGFKFFGRGGCPLALAASADAGAPAGELERVALALKKSSIPTRLRWADFAPDYIRTALQRGGLDFQKAAEGASKQMRVAVEAGNGMGGRIFKEFAELVPQFRYVFADEVPDGRFPKIIPNPLNAGYQAVVKALVRESRADVGVCFDGDADRVALADEHGEMLQPSLLTVLVGQRVRQKLGAKQKIAHNLACSWAVADTLGRRDDVLGDGPTIMTPVGYGKVKAAMHGNKSIAFAAEHSGHYMFREFYTTDSGMLAGLVVLELVCELHAAGRTLSSVLEDYRVRYQDSGEINFKLPEGTDIPALISRVVKSFSAEAARIYAVGKEGVRLTDSYPPAFELAATDVRVEAKDWWFVMRASGTEPMCRLYVEADGDRSLMERKRDALIELVGAQYKI